ncbi:hypothetical protein [Acinetobacter baumannii]|uniref:hypothetical protein n=1 Tax=Acinetobacter baumannii TaxID=470 RepID=UPI0002AEA3A3|nr:hypothetical protein [Acinetobacter baumannii]ELW77822.1 hypothetical protein ACINWCA92_3217 [Acinetobacter baumannii WC-A-92]
MDYSHLQHIALEVCQQADKFNIPYKVYWYSPDSRKANPKSFQQIQVIFNLYRGQVPRIKEFENFKCKDDIGFDVYQRVNELHLFIEPDNVSSKKFTVEGIKKRIDYWKKCQLQVLENIQPPMPQRDINSYMNSLTHVFDQAIAYLQAKNSLNAKLRVRRNSGFRHRMVRIDLADRKSKKEGFSDLVFVFSAGRNFSHVKLPKEPSPTRKPRSDSIKAQYYANPLAFKYYDNFGIFEIYDR